MWYNDKCKMHTEMNSPRGDAKMRKTVFRIVLSALCFTLMAGLTFAAEINISAAASLREAINELSDVFAKKNPGVTLQRNYSGSGALAKQIENGAPCDVFFSANPEWVDYLKEKKLVDGGNIATFAFNELVFVGKPELKAGSLQDVVRLDKIAIGSPRSVPAGQYAMEAFKKAGIDKQLEKKLVMARDVRECLLYADRGEVSGAFVYKTDAEQMAKNVKILFTVPQGLYPRVTYPMALTVSGVKKAEAVAFYKFMRSPEAKMVLSKYGFPVK
jgi:molybdate transport system substrate-binding protein